MINSDPQFTNPEGLDFSLNQSSPGIDVGNPIPSIMTWIIHKTI